MRLYRAVVSYGRRGSWCETLHYRQGDGSLLAYCCLKASGLRDAAVLVVRVGQESTLCRTPPLTFTSLVVLQVFCRFLPEEIGY